MSLVPIACSTLFLFHSLTLTLCCFSFWLPAAVKVVKMKLLQNVFTISYQNLYIFCLLDCWCYCYSSLRIWWAQVNEMTIEICLKKRDPVSRGHRIPFDVGAIQIKLTINEYYLRFKWKFNFFFIVYFHYTHLLFLSMVPLALLDTFTCTDSIIWKQKFIFFLIQF